MPWLKGCVTVGQACANLARTLRANRKRVPIYKGAELPLIGNGHTHLDEAHFFGSDGLGNAPNAFPKVIIIKPELVPELSRFCQKILKPTRRTSTRQLLCANCLSSIRMWRWFALVPSPMLHWHSNCAQNLPNCQLDWSCSVAMSSASHFYWENGQ